MPEYASENVGRHLLLTTKARDAGARLVVWPESAVPFLFDEDRALAALLRAEVREKGIYLFFGNDDIEPLPSGGRRIYVGAKLLDPSGALVARYHKIHLVPFGEYVPLQPLFTLGGRFAAKLVQEVSDFTPGTRPSSVSSTGTGWAASSATRPSSRRSSAASPPGEPSSWSTSRTTRGTAPPRRPHQHLAMVAVPRDREPSLPGPRGEHRRHRGRRPEGPGARADAAVRHDGRSSARCRSSRRDLLHAVRRRLRPGLRRDGRRPRRRDARSAVD